MRRSTKIFVLILTLVVVGFLGYVIGAQITWLEYKPNKQVVNRIDYPYCTYKGLKIDKLKIRIEVSHQCSANPPGSL